MFPSMLQYTQCSPNVKNMTLANLGKARQGITTPQPALLEATSSPSHVSQYSLVAFCGVWIDVFLLFPSRMGEQQLKLFKGISSSQEWAANVFAVHKPFMSPKGRSTFWRCFDATSSHPTFRKISPPRSMYVHLLCASNKTTTANFSFNILCQQTAGACCSQKYCRVSGSKNGSNQHPAGWSNHSW